MQAVQLILLLVIACFAGQTYTVRADGTGNYVTLQQCEDNLTKSYTGVGKDTCKVTQSGTYIGNLAIAGQTNVDAANHPLFIGLNKYSDVIVKGLTSVVSYTELEDFTFEQSVNNVVLSSSSSILDIRRCLVNQTYANTAAQLAGSTIKIYSSSFVSLGNGIYTLGGTGLELYNVSSTMLGTNQIAFNHQGASAKAVNCYANHVGSSIYSAFYGTWTNSDYNASSDNSAPGTVKYTSVAGALEADYTHISASSFLAGKGTAPPLSGNKDIDGQSWINYSIGADDPTPVATGTRKCGRLWRMGLAPCKGP